MTQQFIEQTAEDYNIPVHEVEKIIKMYPYDFYSKLEEYLINRAKH